MTDFDRKAPVASENNLAQREERRREEDDFSKDSEIAAQSGSAEPSAGPKYPSGGGVDDGKSASEEPSTQEDEEQKDLEVAAEGGSAASGFDDGDATSYRPRGKISKPSAAGKK